jgi:hypothetical protein
MIATCCRISHRLLLPPGLDTGPVAIHLLSTREGLKGVLLGSVTIMALPPPAAAELQRAYDLGSGSDAATREESHAATRDLVRDYAMSWQLSAGGLSPGGASPPAAPPSRTPHPQPSSSPADQQLSDVLQYLSGHSMPACHALLLYYTSIRHPGPASHSASPITSSIGSASSSALPAPPIARDVRNPSVWPASSRLAQGGAPAGSRLQRVAARCAHLIAVSRDPTYSAWRQQQGSQVDTTDWLIIAAMTALGVWVGGKHLLAHLGFGLPWAGWLLAFLALHLGPGLGPHVLLACAGERLRAGREAVLVSFAVARASTFVAEVVGWLPTPAPLKLLWGIAPTSLVMHGILRPCLHQV